MPNNLTKQEKQRIQDTVINTFRDKQWFNGAGWVKDVSITSNSEDKFIIAFNYYPALDAMYIKEMMMKIGVEYELRSKSAIPGGENNDDLPSHMRH